MRSFARPGYNAVNGTASCANPWLLSTKLRGDWSFDGYVTGDCRAVGDGSYKNVSDGTSSDTVRVTMDAGTDIDCGSTMNQANVARALLDGNISAKLMDTRLTNLLKTELRLGFYNEERTLPSWGRFKPETHVDTPAHRQLALEAAEQGLVLLKHKGVLPLDATKMTSVAVIGPLADATKQLQGNYYGDAPYLISPLEGISNYSSGRFSVSFERGCEADSNETSASNFSVAAATASKADATVLVIGADQLRGGAEGNDRGGKYFPADPKSKADRSIGLPAPQNALVVAIARAVAGKPLVVVVISGESLDLAAVDANANVSAVIWQGYPSQSGGTALARALFGDTVPSGRLPITFYKENYAALVPLQDMGMRPNPATGNPGRTYRFYPGPEVVYPCFTGLSYTTFSHTQHGASLLTVRKAEVVRVRRAARHEEHSLLSQSITVKNTGRFSAATSVLCFLSPPGAGTGGLPIKKLIDFARTKILGVGQSEEVRCNVTASDLSEPSPRPAEPDNVEGQLASAELEALAGRWLLRFGDVERAVVVD